MPIPKCHPNVYRDAAKLVNSGKHVYSCLAISGSLNNSHSNKEWFYRDQYEAMFGPHNKFILEIDKSSGNSLIYCADGAYELRHPFWNRKESVETREYRVMALLFMAAICENP